jgi:hypothetical protein
VFFVVAVLVVFMAIIGTVLGANNLRNLNLALARFGYPAVSLDDLAFLEEWGLEEWGLKGWSEQTSPDAPPRPVVKGVRLPAPTIQVPAYGLVDMRANPATFVRAIRAEPQHLCEALRTGGFPDIVWSPSAIDAQGSECSSFLPLGAKDAGGANGGDDPGGNQSSVFVSLKGDQQGRVLSFRVKFNIDRDEDRSRVIEAGSRAVALFLRQVRWQDDGDILKRISALEAFERDNFGSRLSFKREFGDLPRFNFVARQSRVAERTIDDTFFNAAAWLPATDGHPALWMPATALKPLPLPKARG